MRRLTAAVVFLALALPVAAADDKDDAKKLNGTYTILEVIVDGKPDDKKKDEVESCAIKDGTVKFKTKNREEKATFKVDAGKKPAHIDITPDGEKELVRGIYETKETDKGLELALAFSTGERPKDFKGGGKDQIVVKLLRKKEK